jgi:hypothetical protein
MKLKKNLSFDVAYQAHKNMDYREVLREIEERTLAIRNLLNLITEKQVKTIRKQIDKFQGTESHQLLVFGLKDSSMSLESCCKLVTHGSHL